MSKNDKKPRIHLELSLRQGNVCGKQGRSSSIVGNVTCKLCKQTAAYASYVAMTEEHPVLPGGTVLIWRERGTDSREITFRVTEERDWVIRGFKSYISMDEIPATYTWGYLIGRVEELKVVFPAWYKIPLYYHRKVAMSKCSLVAVENVEDERPELPVRTQLTWEDKDGSPVRGAVLHDGGLHGITVVCHGQPKQIPWAKLVKGSVRILFPAEYVIPDYYYKASNSGEVFSIGYKPEAAEIPVAKQGLPTSVTLGKVWGRVDLKETLPKNTTVFVNLETGKLVKVSISPFVWKEHQGQ